MEKVIIQEEVSITQKEVEEIIKKYENMSDTIKLGILGEVLDKKGIIREIKKLSEIGKEILLMNHKYNNYMKKEESKLIEEQIKKEANQ